MDRRHVDRHRRSLSCVWSLRRPGGERYVLRNRRVGNWPGCDWPGCDRKHAMQRVRSHDIATHANNATRAGRVQRCPEDRVLRPISPVSPAGNGGGCHRRRGGRDRTAGARPYWRSVVDEGVTRLRLHGVRQPKHYPDRRRSAATAIGPVPDQNQAFWPPRSG